jgi:hypothetical protein
MQTSAMCICDEGRHRDAGSGGDDECRMSLGPWVAGARRTRSACCDPGGGRRRGVGAGNVLDVRRDDFLGPDGLREDHSCRPGKGCPVLLGRVGPRGDSRLVERGEMVIPVWVLEPRAGYVRWPVLANSLPKAESLTLYSALTYRAARAPLVPANTPCRIETVGPPSNASWPEGVTHPDGLEEDLAAWEATEALTLIPGAGAELALPSGSFSYALPVRYEWTNSGDTNSGVAWWLPGLLAWGYVEGRSDRPSPPGAREDGAFRSLTGTGFSYAP